MSGVPSSEIDAVKMCKAYTKLVKDANRGFPLRKAAEATGKPQGGANEERTSRYENVVRWTNEEEPDRTFGMYHNHKLFGHMGRVDRPAPPTVRQMQEQRIGRYAFSGNDRENLPGWTSPDKRSGR